MKRISLLLASCLLLCGCAVSGQPHAAAPSQSLQTYFFTFTLAEVQVVDEYAGHRPASGNKLVDAVLHIHNHYGHPIDMYQPDFELRWEDGGPGNFAVPLEALDDTMAPLVHTLPSGESVRFHYIYEVPLEVSDFQLCYLEQKADASGNLLEDGPTYTVRFTL